jgi:PncC family amidohydrolase
LTVQADPLPVERIGAALKARGMTLATAESCTAGMLSAALTTVAGASQWYRGGVVVYSDDLKISLVDVDRRTLEEYGAVSSEVALELATGVRKACGADIGVGITGIAGPGGGTRAKPAGTVFLAIVGPGETHDVCLNLEGDRAEVRRKSVSSALTRILKLISESQGEESS